MMHGTTNIKFIYYVPNGGRLAPESIWRR